VKIVLTGAFGIDTILRYNQEKTQPQSAFEGYFPFWQVLPEAQLIPFRADQVDPEAVLLVINLNKKTWDEIEPVFDRFKKHILIQFEARVGWELAYEKAARFDYFMSFDRDQSAHPGFRQMYIPYDPAIASSGRDKRGLYAVINQWKSSRKMFIDNYLLRFLPRKKKCALIATLNPNAHYQIRKEIADRWVEEVDVFGGGWPKSMANYRGFVSSKVDLLRRYRFCLVMENQRQNGYITEKLFDCLPAGTVPIYWGAPDIHEYPGLEWVTSIEGTECDLDKLINDSGLYYRAKKQMAANQKKILDTFSIDKFISTICDILLECKQ